MNHILVIGATGRVGRQVAAQLPGHLKVRALVRNPESAHLPPHLEVVRGDLAGLQWTFLRPGMFSANARDWWAGAIRAGSPVRWPYLSAPTAPIDERDIAAIAVRALCAADDDTTHAGRDYVLTGPESLTQREQIEIIGRAIGRPIRVEELTSDQARRELTTIFPAPAVDMLLDAWAAALGQPALVTSTFAELTGARPRTFHQWATDNATYFL